MDRLWALNPPGVTLARTLLSELSNTNIGLRDESEKLERLQEDLDAVFRYADKMREFSSLAQVLGERRSASRHLGTDGAAGFYWKHEMEINSMAISRALLREIEIKDEVKEIMEKIGKLQAKKFEIEEELGGKKKKMAQPVWP